MKKEQIENILENLLSTGGDFAEVFIENKNTRVFNYIDSRLDSLQISNSHGAGLRLAYKKNTYYAAINDFSKVRLKKVINKLKANINSKVLYKYIGLDRLKKYHYSKEKKHYTDGEIKAKLKQLDEKIRSKDKRINQVNLSLQQVKQTVTIANHTGLYVKEDRIRTRLFIIVNLKDGDNTASVSFSKGLSMGYDLLDLIDYDIVIDDLVKTGIDKLYAKPCIGKRMPVIIENGFGGVIFHEACGHAMEATSVAEGISVLSNDLNKVVASGKVTIIDDGTLNSEWGSTKIDDEGCETKKNVLIENGVLKGYLVDILNTRKLDHAITGSGRRESYQFAPTSRMNNTYLRAGNDTFEDMIKDIKLGLYAARLGGGSVAPETGDFNFGCDVAYMIRDGKIAECVKSASLIGNTKEILKEVEMVGANLELGQGMCGSVSGYVPVNVGQPTIKIGNILVGGEASEE